MIAIGDWSFVEDPEMVALGELAPDALVGKTRIEFPGRFTAYKLEPNIEIGMMPTSVDGSTDGNAVDVIVRTGGLLVLPPPAPGEYTLMEAVRALPAIWLS